eukprot:jgi/Bigna1/88626/estExt_fgenesh1_pg.C_350049
MGRSQVLETSLQRSARLCPNGVNALSQGGRVMGRHGAILSEKRTRPFGVNSQTLAVSAESPIEILDTRTESDGRTEKTFGFRITGSEKSPYIKMKIASTPDTELHAVTVPFPGLGVVLEQKVLNDGPVIVVDAKEETGSAIGLLEVGDVLRAFSAVYTVTPPTDTLAFYANPPKKINVRGMFEVDGKNFAKTIAALKSNGELIDRFGEKMEVNDISIVVERKKQE